MNTTMLAAVLHGRKDLRLEQRPRPEVAPGKVLIRVRRAGICGTDVHYFAVGRVGQYVMSAPFVLGHEFTGEIVAVGAAVTKPAIGQRVVVNPAWQCGQCDYCRAGRGNLCRRVRMLGSASTTPPTDGAFSEYVMVGAEQCYPIPPGMDDGLAAIMEPFAVALQALRRAGPVSGKSVVVTGGGPIGLLVVIAARARGATTIAISDPIAERREMALAVGADATLDPTGDGFKEQVATLTGDGFDCLFEASGSPQAIKQAFEVVRRGGTIVQIGLIAAPEIAVPVNQLLVRELQFVGSFRYGDVWEEAIRLVASGRVNLRPLISRVFPFRQVNDALELACARTGVVKVQLDLQVGSAE